MRNLKTYYNSYWSFVWDVPRIKTWTPFLQRKRPLWTIGLFFFGTFGWLSSLEGDLIGLVLYSPLIALLFGWYMNWKDKWQ